MQQRLRAWAVSATMAGQDVRTSRGDFGLNVVSGERQLINSTPTLLKLFGDSKLRGKAYCSYGRHADPARPSRAETWVPHKSGVDTKPSKAVSTCQRLWREPRRLRRLHLLFAVATEGA